LTTIEGKTKLVEPVADPNLVRITTKDSLTANDAAIQADLPVAEDKTAQTCSVFFHLKQHNIPVAYEVRNGSTSFIAKKCKMIPIECVIRRQPHGSYIKRHPEKTSAEIFNPLVIEFFHKDAIVGKEQMSENKARELYLRDGKWTETVYTDPLIDTGRWDMWLLYPPKQPKHEMQPLMDIKPVVDPATLYYIKNTLMIPAFEVLEKAWKEFDVSLIDMKIEVGITNDYEIVIADVIDNDSWRIWPHGDPKRQLDKQSFRDGDKLTEVQKNYKAVTEYTRRFK
jgi:phosphoribosylaminoimidazole-succinocarboxamide synthase